MRGEEMLLKLLPRRVSRLGRKVRAERGAL